MLTTPHPLACVQQGKERRRRVWGRVRSRFLAGFLALYACILAYAAWVAQQPSGRYTSIEHARRIAPVFLAPLLALAVHTVFAQLHAAMDRRADKQIAALQSRLRKTISELKDSTRFQRTQALLEKFDPDLQLARAAPPGGPEGAPNRNTTAANRAAVAAAGAAAGAGAKVSSALGQLWSQAANTLMAEDPMMVHMLQQAQQHTAALERENEELRRRLGLPFPRIPEPLVPWEGDQSDGQAAGAGGGSSIAAEEQTPLLPAALAAQPAKEVGGVTLSSAVAEGAAGKAVEEHIEDREVGGEEGFVMLRRRTTQVP